MHGDDTPTYISDAEWNEIIDTLNANPPLRRKLGVKLDAFSGTVTEDMVADQFGGMFGIFPVKWRGIIEADRAAQAAAAA